MWRVTDSMVNVRFPAGSLEFLCLQPHSESLSDLAYPNDLYFRPCHWGKNSRNLYLTFQFHLQPRQFTHIVAFLAWIRFSNICFLLSLFSRDSSVGIALSYGLNDRGSRVRFPAGAGNFSLHHRVQNGSGAHPSSYQIGTRGSFLGDKAAGAWSWPLTSI
jgi:hypothetical protein